MAANRAQGHIKLGSKLGMRAGTTYNCCGEIKEVLHANIWK